MNRTQKGALFNSGIALLILALGVVIPVQTLTSVKLFRIWLLITSLFIVISLVLLRIKQSRGEVDFDERDNSIKKNAVLVAFISLSALLMVASFIPNLIVGDNGAIPVCFLPVINITIFLIIMLVNSVAILVQYGRGTKGEEL
ncbi:MAG: hypothetical protein JXM79_06150 [Sedimentisphaerales bacterium]|nr:hypothetical protein [Sedimentisphaerales bacterium]